jgi:hypothetical protein
LFYKRGANRGGIVSSRSRTGGESEDEKGEGEGIEEKIEDGGRTFNQGLTENIAHAQKNYLYTAKHYSTT